MYKLLESFFKVCGSLFGFSYIVSQLPQLLKRIQYLYVDFKKQSWI